MTLDDTIRAIVRAELCRILAADDNPNDWIDQSRSPLGRRAHLDLVRRGVLPGCKLGRRVLVRRVDVDAYILEHGTTARHAGEPTSDDDPVIAEMRRAARGRR